MLNTQMSNFCCEMEEVNIFQKKINNNKYMNVYDRINFIY